MPNKDRNIPKRRFKEFENADAWELRKLGEVAEIVMGQSPDSKNYTDNPLDNILVQGNADLRDGCVVPRVWTTQVTKTAEKGDLILSVRAPVGDVGRTNYNVVLGRGVAGIKGNEFIYHLLVKMKLFGYWTKLSTGSTFESINSDDIKNSIILFPSLPEQEAIGTFFSTLDRQITLHQRKLDKLKSVKQAYLSEMFPAEGERVPKRRFPGFTDDWELRKLNNIADVRDGTHNSPRYIEFGYPLVTSKNIKNGQVNFEDIQYISSFDYEEINKRSKVNINDILMGMIGTVGNLALVREEPEFAIKNVALIKNIGVVNIEFLYHYLGSYVIERQLQNSLDGGTQKFISLNKIRHLDIAFPSLPEQEAIGTFFSTLDQQITLHQRKLEKLKNLKKALLNELFV
ncbi:TPA: restriction endonuclease subunit S [Streptococcus suis]|nr:restriction endonuclease subunit S [Streptococcus suis]